MVSVDIDDWVRYSPFGWPAGTNIGRVTEVNPEFCLVDPNSTVVHLGQILEVRKPPPAKVLDTDFVFNLDQT